MKAIARENARYGITANNVLPGPIETPMLDANRLDDLADYLATGVEALIRAGADLGFIAANTPHLVFGEVQRRSAIPLCRPDRFPTRINRSAGQGI